MAHGLSPDAYADAINAGIGAEVRARREALRLSAYRLGRVCGVSDQTILNIEQGAYKNGSLVKTLARMCVRFDISLAKLVAAAEGRVRAERW